MTAADPDLIGRATRQLVAVVDRRPRDPEIIGDRARTLNAELFAEDRPCADGGARAAFAATSALWAVGAATDAALDRARAGLR